MVNSRLRANTPETLPLSGDRRRRFAQFFSCGTAILFPAILSSAIPSSYSFFFTRTTVILANPSSKAGGFSFAAMRRMMSSGTTRSRR